MNPGNADGAGFEQGRRVPISWPALFRPRSELRPRVAKACDVRRTALRFLLGVEQRSMRQAARELDVTPACVSAAFTRLSCALGFRRFLKSAAAREKYSTLMRERWRKKKADAANPIATPANKKTECLP
mgnify:CR=1 FL=1